MRDVEATSGLLGYHTDSQEPVVQTVYLAVPSCVELIVRRAAPVAQGQPQRIRKAGEFIQDMHLPKGLANDVGGKTVEYVMSERVPVVWYRASLREYAYLESGSDLGRGIFPGMLRKNWNSRLFSTMRLRH